jgi:L-iditol 2-dehydrogenase
LTARAFGASSVCITDINEKRLTLAKELGATHTLLIKKGDSAETLASEVGRLMGAPPQITIECSGAESSIQLAILATRSGGTLVLVGLGPIEVKVPLVNAAVREVDIRGVFRYKNCYPLALSLIADKKVDVKPLVTHRFELEQTLEAFQTAAGGEAIKVIINCKQN